MSKEYRAQRYAGAEKLTDELLSVFAVADDDDPIIARLIAHADKRMARYRVTKGSRADSDKLRKLRA